MLIVGAGPTGLVLALWLTHFSVRVRIIDKLFAWRAAMKDTGLRKNAVYLVRPDGYIGLADAQGRAAAVSAYLDKNKIQPTNQSWGL